MGLGWGGYMNSCSYVVLWILLWICGFYVGFGSGLLWFCGICCKRLRKMWVLGVGLCGVWILVGVNWGLSDFWVESGWCGNLVGECCDM